MKKIILSLSAVALLLGVFSVQSSKAAFVPGEATAEVLLSSTTPVVGDNMVVTIHVTNTDSVTHTFNSRVSVIANTSVYGCNPSELGAVFAKNPVTKLGAGETATYMFTLVAPAKDCVPNADYRVGIVVLDGSNTVANTTTEFVVGQPQLFGRILDGIMITK